MCIASRLTPDCCECTLEVVQAAKREGLGPHDVWAKLKTMRQRRIVYMVLCATCSQQRWAFHSLPQPSTQWPRKYCGVCKSAKSLALQICVRCTFTVAACQCRAKSNSPLANKIENKETAEGPGFVSEAFCSKVALLQAWVYWGILKDWRDSWNKLEERSDG